ncbi:DUF4350 domain-containing protein [Limnofasciculus baicalensis]|uniref:DUF4350 domain-containing protein n=1 Tax=Limnofasciculus baicalensis BBK-W-15 TaxID=2699891 RepID=A0AAE3KN84_9CYAN|nr:DUF4350 domain-containing protein [Limnofasciculus baicalensis]MCP2729541.1 DUF4350 domain-containing protein [Limnofasciculus baicalensis BBK-W-15]
MKIANRKLWIFGAIAIGVIILITLVAAPTSNKLMSGSTYSRSPDGYGAWYAFMSERGTPIQRWQKPFSALVNSKDAKSPITFLRVNSNLTTQDIGSMEQIWVKKGNALVILGVRKPVTDAPFSTMEDSPEGKIKIDTSRRYRKYKQEPEDKQLILGDKFGAIVWQEEIDKGKIIFVTTPHLAANAYQDIPGNYELLAKLVTQSGGGKQRNRGTDNLGNEGETKNISITSPNSSATKTLKYFPQTNNTSAAKSTTQSITNIWVDEYIHGYKDSEVLNCQNQSTDSPDCKQEQTLFGYLAKTAIFPAFLQGLIILLITIWAANRRFGQPVTLTTPVVNNSEAYILALAGVLQKAGSSEFILDIVGKEQQLQLQKSLGLGDILLDRESLINAWVQQTGHPATELEQLLREQPEKLRMRDKDLLNWLEKWQKIHQSSC